jgi:hypothetical protein
MIDIALFTGAIFVCITRMDTHDYFYSNPHFNNLTPIHIPPNPNDNRSLVDNISKLNISSIAEFKLNIPSIVG